MGPSHDDGDHRKDESTPDRRTRRRYLAGIAAAGSVAIAGCGGGGGGGGDGGGNQTNGSDESNDSEGPAESGETSDDDQEETSCGPAEITYERLEIRGSRGMEEGVSLATVEVPTDADVTRTAGGGLEVDLAWTDEEIDFSISAEQEFESMDSFEESSQFDQYVETSDRYEFAYTDTRSFVYERTVDDRVPQHTFLYMPVEDQTLNVDFIISRQGLCMDALERTIEHVIPSVQPI
jgi:hypothetical protein